MRFLLALGRGLRLRGARRLYALLQSRDVGAVARKRKRHRRSPREAEHIAVGMIHGDALEQLRRPAILCTAPILNTDRQIGDPRSSRGRAWVDAPVAGLHCLVAGRPQISLAASAEIAHLRALWRRPGDNGPAAEELARLRLANLLRLG